jgi:RND family efflux transporter MFP subunit
VKTGQVLAELDARVLQAQLRQQEAGVVEAKSTLAVAENNHRRAVELVNRGIISSATLDDRVSAAETGAARLAAAEAARDELAARVAQAKIVAPADGRIAKRSILPGDVVNPGTETFRLIRDDRLELDAQIPEADMAQLAPGQSALVIHEGSDPVQATVRLVAPTVDPKTRLGLVYLSLPPNSGLRAGMYARCEITLDDRAVPAVPDEAVVWRAAQHAIVFVIGNDGRVTSREIVPGTRQNGWIEIKSGLAPTDRIAVAGAGFLSDGDKVKVSTQPAASAAADGPS